MPIFSERNKVECGFHFAFCGRDVLLHEDGGLLSEQEMGLAMEKNHVAHWIAEASPPIAPESSYESAVLEEAEGLFLPEGCARFPLRQFFIENGMMGQNTARLATRAKSLNLWHASMRFCPKCATALLDHESETARFCPSCGALHFPRIEPCIIVAVHREGRILLARHAQRNTDVFTTLAGFIEHGEGAAEAVAREVREEVGIEIQNIRFAGSQPWPFPGQLMLGFHADYKSGEIRVQEREIAEAAWFDPENLPPTPPPGSTAYQLIRGLI